MRYIVFYSCHRLVQFVESLLVRLIPARFPAGF